MSSERCKGTKGADVVKKLNEFFSNHIELREGGRRAQVTRGVADAYLKAKAGKKKSPPEIPWVPLKGGTARAAERRLTKRDLR